MALYLVDVEAGRVLVRAGNGHEAKEFLGITDANVERVTEEGPVGLVSAVAVPVVAPVDDDDDWIDVSSLSTPAGKVEQMHRDTRETRLVDKD